MNLIRLDWDDITWSECRERLSLIKAAQLVQSIEIRFSPRSGFHILVSSYHYLPITRIWFLRRLWKDDGNRLALDVLYYPAYFRDVLFQKKGEDKEEWIMTYTRFNYNSDEWKNTERNPQKIFNPKVQRKRSYWNRRD